MAYEHKFCRNGHLLSEDNSIWSIDNGRKRRRCKICTLARRKGTFVPLTPTERFWARVDKSLGQGPQGECWQWLDTERFGYGQVDIDGKRQMAHRYSYELVIGPVPAGLFLRHKCDNPICVNPDHLTPGTHQQNMDDMVERRRHKTHREPITHCPKGHEYTPANKRYLKRGDYYCLQCDRARTRNKKRSLGKTDKPK